MPEYIPREAFYSNKNLLNIDLCLNKICGDFVTAYPLGIPILAQGEIITSNVITIIKDYLKNNINVIGIDRDNQISVKCKKIEV